MPAQSDQISEADQTRLTRIKDWLTDTTPFTGAQFQCHLDPRTLNFDVNGNLRCALVIPPGQTNQALSLRYLIRDRLPLLVTIDIPEEFKQLAIDQESYLRSLRDLPTYSDSDDEFVGDS